MTNQKRNTKHVYVENERRSRLRNFGFESSCRKSTFILEVATTTDKTS